MIVDLLTKFSVRFNNENDLSDLAWTLCEISEKFKELFLCFFFPGIKGKHSAIDLQREYNRGNSRPDFYFVADKQEYLIEVKKYDTNDHFEQYLSDFPNAQRGWIAIYRVSKQNGFEIKTWEEFYFYLEKEAAGIEDQGTKDIILGFREYLKSVCYIIKFEPMILNNLQSLYFFNKHLPALIEKERPDIISAIYSQPKSYFEDRSGTFLSLKKSDKTDIYYPWFGIYYDESKTYICIGFSIGWCKNIYEGIKKDNKVNPGEYFKPVYPDENCYWFEMKDEIFEQLNVLKSVDAQKQLLDSFLSEVLAAVYEYL